MVTQAILNPDLERAVLSLTEECGEVYLVGGAIRNHLLGLECRDIDFVVKKNAVVGARKLADELNGKFYILDAERGTGRVLVKAGGTEMVVDFATMMGEDILADLRMRDFTINAIALDVRQPERLIDPLQGERDLEERVLKPCSPASFQADPVRVLRAVRFQVLFQLKIDANSKELIREAAWHLGKVSAERKRDEIFHVFESGHIAENCELLRDYGIWNEVFPSLEQIEGEIRFAPHVHTLVDHTQQVMNYCDYFFQSLATGENTTNHRYLHSGCANLLEFREPLLAFLNKRIHPQRRYEGLIYLGILYHDIGKTVLMKAGNSNFEDHAAVGADFFRNIVSSWALSNDEASFIERFIRNHSIRYPIVGLQDVDSRLNLHRFFRRAGKAGVLLAIFYQADILSAYEDTVTEERWQRAMRTSHALLDCWFNHYREIIDPPVIVDGDELMHKFHVKPGKIVGEMLESIREAQASGKVNTKENAIECARAVFGKNKELRND